MGIKIEDHGKSSLGHWMHHEVKIDGDVHMGGALFEEDEDGWVQITLCEDDRRDQETGHVFEDHRAALDHYHAHLTHSVEGGFVIDPGEVNHSISYAAACAHAERNYRATNGMVCGGGYNVRLRDGSVVEIELRVDPMLGIARPVE